MLANIISQCGEYFQHVVSKFTPVDDSQAQDTTEADVGKDAGEVVGEDVKEDVKEGVKEEVRQDLQQDIQETWMNDWRSGIEGIAGL